MVAVTALNVEKRAKSGTGPARETRRLGRIPGILYGTKLEPLMISVDEKSLLKEVSDPHYHTKLYDLNIDNKNHRALIRQVQLNPVTDRPLHIDFLRVDASSRLVVDIPLKFINSDKSPGIKRGGVLNIVYHELQLSCPANEMPENITIDLTGLEVGHSIHLNAIELPKGTHVAHAGRDYTLATIVAPSGLKSEETTEEAPTDTAAPETPESK